VGEVVKVRLDRHLCWHVWPVLVWTPGAFVFGEWHPRSLTLWFGVWGLQLQDTVRMPWWLYRIRYIWTGVRMCAPWELGSDWTFRQAWTTVSDDCDAGDAIEHWARNESPEDDAAESLSYWTGE
jgi:hypothetical protein